MKRIFINRVLAFLLIGATLTYAGCKDYDDDIGNVQTELSETAAALQEQLGALQTALTGAQNEAAAATQKAAAAKEAADEAAETAAAAHKTRPQGRGKIRPRSPSPMPRRKPFGRLFLNASL